MHTKGILQGMINVSENDEKFEKLLLRNLLNSLSFSVMHYKFCSLHNGLTITLVPSRAHSSFSDIFSSLLRVFYLRPTIWDWQEVKDIILILENDSHLYSYYTVIEKLWHCKSDNSQKIQWPVQIMFSRATLPLFLTYFQKMWLHQNMVVS